MSYYCLQHHLMNTAQLLTAPLQPPIDQLQSTNLSAPDVDSLHNLNVGTFKLANHENYKRFFQ